MKRFLALIFIVGLVVGSITLLLVKPQKVAEKGSASVAWLADNNQANSDGFKRVFGPSEIVFPRDLGSHDDYQTEWWYYTGNLETSTGRPFGFQLTIFRRGLTPSIQPVSTDNRSDWRTNQVYFAHFTISDIADKAFYPAERFSRGAAGLAGARAVPYRVWLQDWSFTEIAPGQVQLAAKTDQVALDLVVKETLPPVLQGDRPHEWLFPRMAAVVHHGGTNTTAEGLRAGVPSIIVPFFGDQPMWGQRVADLGVGSSPIPYKQLSVEGLAAAIQVAVSDEAMRNRAIAIRQRIRAENGVANAVEAFHRHLTNC